MAQVCFIPDSILKQMVSSSALSGNSQRKKMQKIETSFNPGGNILGYNVQKCCFCDKKEYSP